MENISSHLRKEYWRRRVAEDAVERHIPIAAGYYYDPLVLTQSEGDYDNYTQEDFMRENTSSAHKINSKFMSLRPIYDVRTKKDADGNPVLDEDGKVVTEWFVVDFDKLETVRFGYQKRINSSKSAYVGGGELWITPEDKSDTNGSILNSWKDSMGLQVAWQELVSSLYHTGDGAIYPYFMNGELHYQVFSYAKGDILFPDYDESYNPVLYRLYTLRGKRAVDKFTGTHIETWVEGDKDEGKNLSWWTKFSGWFAKGMKWDTIEKSEDGWRCVRRTRTQIPDGMIQCVYWRIDDIPSGVVEQEICALESSASFVADGVKSVSQAVLFIKAADIDSLPNNDTTGKKIGVKGTVDELAASDAKFLVPPDLSNIATIDADNKRESIIKSSMSANVTAEVFRSGDPSSASMKLLYADETIWCKIAFTQLYPQLKYLVKVFKELVDKAAGAEGKIANMRTSCGVEFWLPENESEVLKRELDKASARVQSRKATIENIGNAHLNDYEQIRDEWEEELRIKAEIPAKAKAEVEAEYGEPTEIIEVDEDKQPNPVDKRMPGRSIQDRD